MTDISQKEAEALARILSLAENHRMWTEPMWPQDFKDDTYEAISVVREFLKRNGVPTLHAMIQEAMAKKETE